MVTFHILMCLAQGQHGCTDLILMEEKKKATRFLASAEVGRFCADLRILFEAVACHLKGSAPSHRFSLGFRSGDWLGSLRDLDVLLLEPWPCVLGHCPGGGILRYMAPVQPSVDVVTSSCTPQQRHSPKAQCFHGADGVLGVKFYIKKFKL